jgi:hypothetical protein
MNNIDFKKIYLDVLQSVSKTSGEDIHKLTLETTINIDLGIYGDDWDEIILPIIAKYPIDDFSAFAFTNHMNGEADFDLTFPLDFILVIPKILIALLLFPFNKKISNTIFMFSLHRKAISKKEPLYIADIFNSAVKGKWEYAIDSNLNLKEMITE